MKRLFKIFLFVLLFFGVAYLVAFGLFNWWMGHEFIDQSSGPLTREKAFRHCPVPLPASAHDVQYFTITGGLQYAEMYARFEAPVADCRAAAQKMFADAFKHRPDYRSPEFRASNSGEPVQNERRFPLGWFDTDRPSKWEIAGTGYGWEPKIWIDAERGIFYFHVSD